MLRRTEMTKRILDSRLPLVVYNPSGVFDTGYLEECHRAGALPVFDTEFFSDDAALAGVRKLSEAKIIFGVRLDGRREPLVKALLGSPAANMDAVIMYFDGGLPEKFDDRGFTGKIILETVDFISDEALSVMDPQALIVRGNEAGGRVSRFTSFIIKQWYLENSIYPVFVHGGVGFHTAPGIISAGCSGIVLDSQLYCMEESPLSENFKKIMASVEEGDSTVVGEPLKRSYRFFSKLGTKITKDLKEMESFLKEKPDGGDLLYKEITSRAASLNDSGANAMQALFYLGQDGALPSPSPRNQQSSLR
jgi:hypothetical protein